MHPDCPSQKERRERGCKKGTVGIRTYLLIIVGTSNAGDIMCIEGKRRKKKEKGQDYSWFSSPQISLAPPDTPLTPLTSGASRAPGGQPGPNRANPPELPPGPNRGDDQNQGLGYQDRLAGPSLNPDGGPLESVMHRQIGTQRVREAASWQARRCQESVIERPCMYVCSLHM